MRMLDLKLLRDFRRLWAQALAVSFVVAAGAATLLMGVGTYQSLLETRAAFYERAAFADLFAQTVRAPESLRTRIAAISGVAAVQTRIVQSAVLDMAGMDEPATGVLISLPDYHPLRLNRLHLREGRLPEPFNASEVVISEKFAQAHGLRPGGQFQAILNGRKQRLQVSGIVISPEYIYAINPGGLVPDNKRFGIFWMSESVLATRYDFDGAFNSLTVKLLNNADEERVAEAIDVLLAPYGGEPAYGRDLQPSHAFLQAELDQLRGSSRVLPPMFLIVAAFLIAMILARMIELERSQIGLLKALGYRTWSIGLHYVKFALLVVFIGALAGIALGLWAAQGLTALYTEFFNFPVLVMHQPPALILLSLVICLLAALAGAWRSVRHIANLPAAVAMAPPVPPHFRKVLAGSRAFFLSRRMMISLRHMIRRPIRTGLTGLGLALPVGLLLGGLFPLDAVEHLIDTHYFHTERQDATLYFAPDIAEGAAINVRQLPEVWQGEAFRAVPAILYHRQFSRRVSLTGKVKGAHLNRLVNRDLVPIEVPEHGIVLTEKLAELLHVGRGEIIQVQTLTGKRRNFDVPVSEIAGTYIGLAAVMELNHLNDKMDDGLLISGVHAGLDPSQAQSLYQRTKSLPAISAITLQKDSLASFREVAATNASTITTVYVFIAVMMAFGIVYNSGRIQLSERARELASLCVLGFTRGEVSRIMLGEVILVSMAAIPIGWLCGYGLAVAMAQSFSNELYQIPAVLERASYGRAALTVLFATALCAIIIHRRIRRFDLTETLKARD